MQVFTLVRGGCDKHKCHNKTPDRKWAGDVNDVMPGSDGLGFLGIWKKKQLVEIWDWTKRVGIRIWAKPVHLFAAGCAPVCWVSELRADAGRTVSVVEIISLSPRVENLKVKKVIKVPYLNQESRQRLTHSYICIIYSWHIRRLWLWTWEW